MLDAACPIELLSNGSIRLLSFGVTPKKLLNANCYLHFVDQKSNVIIKEIDMCQVLAGVYKQSKDICRILHINHQVTDFVFMSGAVTFGVTECFRVENSS